MPDQDQGLGGLRDVARALNADEEWEWKQAKTRADLRRSTNELLSHAEKLRESVDELGGGTVHELHREPTATVELTEDELSGVIEALDAVYHGTPEQQVAFQKLNQALAIELGPGGNFRDSVA